MDFFSSHQHKIVASAPMVIKDDPTLMFTNAGMNQFKDIFLGNRSADLLRVANTQKCLRVSGKHNDLEEVGHDTYHHTMFEMLGNWSFGDYFKEEAMRWAWELLTGIYSLDPQRLYATVFSGDEADGLDKDEEASVLWRKWLPDDHIIPGSRKDNFWEMGDTGPCGPCSEIHIDLRDEEARNAIPGSDLVNNGHPLVIEIWNLVFIQFNRLTDGTLMALPKRHVDTGMGFERLCMALQGKTSSYDTDIFKPLTEKTGELCGKIYGVNEKDDIAFRVIADHVRAVTFSIADGQLPSNVKAGYVIRRILRRAIRYGYTYLGFKEPFINRLVPVIVEQMGRSFPELVSQKSLIMKVIAEEESSFLRTLATGIHLLDQMIEELKKENKSILDGTTAFLLYDTYGFPADLTSLILAENGLKMDNEGFMKELDIQKTRSRDASKMDVEDWVIVHDESPGTRFTGYDTTESTVRIIKYRKTVLRDKVRYQLVLDQTPFYAESGGQIGDIGEIRNIETGEQIEILNTLHENLLIVHITDKLPSDPSRFFIALVDREKRSATARNHSATHLLHLSLRMVLGEHVEQKGSLVNPDYFRFDFAHFGKMNPEEIEKTETLVNGMILRSMRREEKRDIPLQDAKKMGAVSLFGEKYGDKVRVIGFGDSIELCGGTHVENTGEIGVFKILSEGAIAAGIRRIEAITSWTAIRYYEDQLRTVNRMKELVRNHKDPLKALENMIEKLRLMEDQLAEFERNNAEMAIKSILEKAETVSGIRFVAGETSLQPANIKDIAFSLRTDEKNLVMVLTSVKDDKPGVAVFVSQDLINNNKLSASNIIKEISPLINGGGGGQDFFATAGGKRVEGLADAVSLIRKMLEQLPG